MKPLADTSLSPDIHYRRLQRHLDRQPVGFPPSRQGSDIRLLKHIFTPLEARVAVCLSHEPRSLADIWDCARKTVASSRALEKILDGMVEKGGLSYHRENGTAFWANAPLVVGMYEFQVNRLTPEFIADFKAYTSEKRFGISFLSTRRSQMRTIPIEKSLRTDLPAADYDQVILLIEKASPPFVVIPCICRKKKALQGEPCRQTDRSETCLAMGRAAQTLMKMGVGRQISRSGVVRIVRNNQAEGLVLQPSNTREIDFLCSCCGCCCSMLALQKDLPLPLDFWESGFRAVLQADLCVGCGRCKDRCGTGALCLASPGGTESRRPVPVLDSTRCIGCGQCTAACKTGALGLVPRPKTGRPPENREAFNAVLLENRTKSLSGIAAVAKLARGMVLKQDLRLLKP